jgi:20S proteasome alpha/beta subunit
MTIGVGFQCGDSVVLCADRQFTSKEGRFKYQGKKLGSSQRGFLSLIYTYAGDPDRSEVIFGKLCANLEKKIKEPGEESPRERIRDALEEIYYDPQSEGLETLLGIRWKNFDPHLYRTSGATVVSGLKEQIGYGDSSVLRYLSDFIPQGTLTVEEAITLGAYTVFVAGRFVDQCGEEADHIILYRDGAVVNGSGVFDNQRARFFYCEEQAGQRLRELILSGGTK